MTNAILSVNQISKSFGSLKASDNITLDIQPGEIHALIGPNGAGKSTLIKQLAGELKPDSGSIDLLGTDVTKWNTVKRARLGLGRSFQISAVVPEFTVLQNIVLSLLGRESKVYHFIKPWTRYKQFMDEGKTFAATVQLTERLKVSAAELSHGERRRLEMAMALALKPKVLLLDEPMAGMGSEGLEEMTQLLADIKQDAPIFLVEHDMDAVFALADRISVLVYGRVIATGTVEEIRNNQAVREAYLGEDDA